MANPGYVRSTDGNDADDGSTWALANATLAGGFADASAGDRIYVSDNHAESQAALMTLASPGTSASPVTIVCADDTAEPPTAVATTATITTTGSNNIVCSGYAYCFGINFVAGVRLQFSNSGAMAWTLDNCTIDITNSAGTLDIGTSANLVPGKIVFRDVTVTFNGTGAQIRCATCDFEWVGGSVAGTVPATLFSTNTSGVHSVTLRGVDLSAVGTGKNLVLASENRTSLFKFIDCKLGSGVSITTGSIVGPAGCTVLVVNCDSADTNYRYAKVCYQGEITQETTVVRTGGASDGTTGFSRKMVSSANSKFYSPLVFGDVESPICVWNETVGSSVTVTVETVTDNVTLTDAEAWIEVEYLGTSGFPIASFISDRAADILATPANQTTSSETWTTTGLTTPVKQKLSVSFTPQEKGWIQVRVMLAKASTTVYFCPKVDVT